MHDWYNSFETVFNLPMEVLPLLNSDGTVPMAIAIIALLFSALFFIYKDLKRRMASHDERDNDREKELEAKMDKLEEKFDRKYQALEARQLAEQAKVEKLSNDMTKALTILEFLQTTMKDYMDYIKRPQ